MVIIVTFEACIRYRSHVAQVRSYALLFRLLAVGIGRGVAKTT